MKTSQRSNLLFFVFLGLFLLTTSASYAQIQIKGIVKGKSYEKTEVLNGANIYLKGTSIGTSTDRKGEFTFPRPLRIGDVIEVSYLGFVKKSIKIKADSGYLTITLVEDDNEMLGALNTNKRFKSKRFKKKN